MSALHVGCVRNRRHKGDQRDDDGGVERGAHAGRRCQDDDQGHRQHANQVHRDNPIRQRRAFHQANHRNQQRYCERERFTRRSNPVLIS